MLNTMMLMIMLTGGEGAPADASFLEVDTVAECEERVARARAVFPAAGLVYRSHHCVKSPIAFEPFLHNDTPTGPKYFMALTFSKDGSQLKAAQKFASMKACEKSHKGACVVSYQDITE